MIYEKIQKVAQELPSEDLPILLQMLNQCGEYVKKVNEMGNTSIIGKQLYEGEDYRERMGSIDKSRSVIHNALIVGVKAVNRLCELHKLMPLYDGDIENRIEVAEFAMQVLNENFMNRKK